jgi:hypothetical protein
LNLNFVENIEEDLGEGEEQNRMKNQSGDCLVCKHDVIDAEKFVQDC